MAESRSNNLEMGLHFDVAKQPVLMVLCDGDMDKTVAYGGKLDHDMKSAEVEKWLESYAKSYATGCARVKAVPKQWPQTRPFEELQQDEGERDQGAHASALDSVRVVLRKE